MSDLLDNVSIDLVKKAIDLSALEHQLIANNIANAKNRLHRTAHIDFNATFAELQQQMALSESGESGESIDKLSVKQSLEQLTPQLTVQSNHHQAGQSETVIDQEMAAMATNKVRHQALIEALKRLGALNSMAIRGGNR